MIKEKIPALNSLSKDEKLRLAGELWSEVFGEEDIELTDAQKEELERRIRYAEEHPEEMTPWEAVRDELKKKYDV
ncbi:MAG TPA: addiction module protein [Balneolaceae bacterium]